MLIVLLTSKIDSKITEYSKSLAECESRSMQSLVQLSANQAKLMNSKPQIIANTENMERETEKVQKKVEALNRFVNKETSQSIKNKLIKFVTPSDGISKQLLAIASKE